MVVGKADAVVVVVLAKLGAVIAAFACVGGTDAVVAVVELPVIAGFDDFTVTKVDGCVHSVAALARRANFSTAFTLSDGSPRSRQSCAKVALGA